MCAAVHALLFAGLLVAPATLAAAQSQFTRSVDQVGEMRFRDMDRNNDGVVTRAEWRGTEQSFRTNDWNGDGILSGNEVRPGATRPSSADADALDDRGETFDSLDTNRNNQVERGEWRSSADAFQWLDRNNDGVLTRREVVGRGAVGRRGARNPRDPRIAASGSQDCVSNAARIVDDIYQQVLERPADQASAGMTQALASGRMTVRDIVAQVAKSEEHGTRYFWNPLATTLYRQMLNRDPSAQEVQQMAADLSSGRSRMPDVIARTARRAANSDEEAVRILYRRLLGREADESGLRGFTDQARREGIEAVARDIMASPEYRQRATASRSAPDDAEAYHAAVRSLYRHVLGRDPDPVGLDDLTSVAMTGGFDAVVDRMVTSDEYQRMYGTDVVPGRGSRYCPPAQ